MSKRKYEQVQVLLPEIGAPVLGPVKIYAQIYLQAPAE